MKLSERESSPILLDSSKSEQLSQPYLGYISQLERGTEQPKSPALVLLNVIRGKGLAAIQI